MSDGRLAEVLQGAGCRACCLNCFSEIIAGEDRHSTTMKIEVMSMNRILLRATRTLRDLEDYLIFLSFDLPCQAFQLDPDRGQDRDGSEFDEDVNGEKRVDVR